MALDGKDFSGRLKSVQIKGEMKVAADGEITSEPEVIVQFALPLTRDTIAQMSWLAAVKAHGGEVMIGVISQQTVMDFAAR